MLHMMSCTVLLMWVLMHLYKAAYCLTSSVQVFSDRWLHIMLTYCVYCSYYYNIVPVYWATETKHLICKNLSPAYPYRGVLLGSDGCMLQHAVVKWVSVSTVSVVPNTTKPFVGINVKFFGLAADFFVLELILLWGPGLTCHHDKLAIYTKSIIILVLQCSILQ